MSDEILRAAGEELYKATYGELHGVLGEAVVSLAAVKRWFQRLKGRNFSFHNKNKPGCRLRDFTKVTSQFVTDGLVTETKRFLQLICV
jgi:hypothetical protein